MATNRTFTMIKPDAVEKVNDSVNQVSSIIQTNAKNATDADELINEDEHLGKMINKFIQYVENNWK